MNKNNAEPQMDAADGARTDEEPRDIMELGKEVMPGIRLRCICRGHQGTIGRIAWSPCGRFIASPSTDKTMRIWDTGNGDCLAVLSGHEGEVYCAAWSADGQYIGSGSQDATTMQNDDALSHLQAADVRICLHGDVHETRRKWVNYWKKGGVHIIGAGTFGSPQEGRPESTPRLYNLLEIVPDLSASRVHTRQQCKAEGAWGGCYEWPDPDGGKGRVPFFDIDLS
jgi:hypothetical protein